MLKDNVYCNIPCTEYSGGGGEREKREAIYDAISPVSSGGIQHAMKNMFNVCDAYL